MLCRIETRRFFAVAQNDTFTLVAFQDETEFVSERIPPQIQSSRAAVRIGAAELRRDRDRVGVRVERTANEY